MIKAIIYDVDNTLIASDPFIKNHVVKTAGKVLGQNTTSKEEVEKLQKNNVSFDELFTKLFRENASKVLEEYRKTSQENPIPETPHAIETVGRMKEKGMIQGVLTNRTRFARERLKQAGFPEFDFVLMPPSIELKKPNPKAFNPALEFLKQKGITKENTLSVGDSLDDFTASKNAGISFIAVLTGQHTESDFMKNGLEKEKIVPNLSRLEEAMNYA